MNAEWLYLTGISSVLIFASIIFPILLWVSAPYGRHRRPGWGPSLNARIAWTVMESPSVVIFAWVFWQGDASHLLAPLVLFTMWQVHYVQRTFIYPYVMRMGGKRDPVVTVAMAIVFNCLNASLNALVISSNRFTADTSWLEDPRFLGGAALFVLGSAINCHSDLILRNLRQPGESGYSIPWGGLYRYVSCPNYFGELVQWTGWALASWSLAGLAFALFTAANLVPRARSHHRWYLDKFVNYPKERKILVPYLY